MISPSPAAFPASLPPPIRIFLLMMGCRRAVDLAKGPPSAVILISILKSGSGIPSSPIYAKRPTLLCIKNLNDGMSQCDSAGFLLSPRGEET